MKKGKEVFEKITNVQPAFDKRNPDPKKNYGIGDCRITFILKGKKGAVQFMIGSGWFLPHVRDELLKKKKYKVLRKTELSVSGRISQMREALESLPEVAKLFDTAKELIGESSGRWTRAEYDEFTVEEQLKPRGWDVGYHSPKPMFKGQTPMTGKCPVLGGKCYYDGSGLRGDEWVEPFLNGGTKWLWGKLEKEYYEIFGK